MKRVLIVAYHFPPDPSIGSLRMKGLAKYLPDFGWEPVILTKKLSEKPNMQINIVETPFEEHDILNSFKRKIGLNPETPIKSSISNKGVNRSLLYSVSRFFMLEFIAYPDIHKNWYSYAYKDGSDLLNNQKIDAIISSSSPEISHIIANSLKDKYDLPWIADFRDLWTQNHYYKYTYLRSHREKKLEINTLSKADSLVTISEPLAEKLRSLHKGKKVYSITNGFDPKEMVNGILTLSDKFTITYTGNLYFGKRDPSKLFVALSELISEKKLNPNNIEVRFYGNKEYWFDKNVEKYGLKRIVNHYGIVPRKIALEKQRESQILLLLLWDNPDELGVYTGKVFEYLSSQRPILALGSSNGSVVKELLEETSAGFYASSVEDIKEFIKKSYDEYEFNNFVSYNSDMIEKYSQREMARKFAEILNDITSIGLTQLNRKPVA